MNRKRLVRSLLDWYTRNLRPLPWRKVSDPWPVWVSEIMLQQTQVATVLPYFTRFMNRFPTIEALANAEEEAVLKSWEGLGYYSRARNLQTAARQVMTLYDGKIPTRYESLIELKGIGPYTAAAISSICSGEAIPAVDGNVLRVVSRWIELPEDISKPQTRQQISSILQPMIPSGQAGDFNQAMMELGALICRPANPDCTNCPVLPDCLAGLHGTTGRFPVKTRKTGKPHFTIAVGLVLKGDQVLVARRREGQMLAGLWEFPGGKVEQGETVEEALIREMKEEVDLQVTPDRLLLTVPHEFTHRKITIHAYICSRWKGVGKALSGSEIRWVALGDLDKMPFPVANQKIIQALKDFLT
ncbi:MAG: A/G-specific adenine glycosylase [Bacteroidetes bacterium]|nr:A/G-specific adenine glycosylase [Bacteroidota bacterium]